MGVGKGTKGVEEKYQKLIQAFDNELKILLEVPQSELETITLPEVAEGIIRVREGKVFIEPGYDGVYGKIRIFSKNEQKELTKQKSLF